MSQLANSKGRPSKGKKSTYNKKWSKKGEVPERSAKEGDYVSETNDYRWYALDPALLKDAASYSYAKALGSRENLGRYASEINRSSVPGFMRIDIAPTFGYSDSATSPINVAANNVYSFVRHANSGHANYDPPDLMLYLMAMDSAYSMLAHYTRIYGIINTYSVTNRYYPKAIVQGLGADFDNLAANLADFRAALNVAAVKIGSMCVPASMSYMAKHMWMFSGLYRDINVDKSQTYAFGPVGHYEYALDTDGAGYLKFVSHAWVDSISTTTGRRYLTNLQGIIDDLNAIIDPIVQSEDMNIMSGDILKAYGPENIYKVASVSETYTVIPSYDEVVLDQIQNASLLGLPWDYKHDEDDGQHPAGTLSLYQSANKDYLIATPQWDPRIHFTTSWLTPLSAPVPGKNAYLADRYVTFNHGAVEPKDTMEATRLTNIASTTTEYTDGIYTFFSVTSKTIGSEVACDAVMYLYREENGEWVLGDHGVRFLENLSEIVLDSASTHIQEQCQKVAEVLSGESWLVTDLAKFNRHPMMCLTHVVYGAENAASATGYAVDGFNGAMMDLNYYTVLQEQDLTMMSEVALLSMLKVTQYGRKEKID